MKTNTTILAILALAAAGLSGCTTTATTASKKPAYDQTTKRVYTQEELQKRGRQTTGESLEAQDASVRLSGGR